MEIIRKPVIVETRQVMVSYVASDGYEFKDRAECERHEIAIGYKGIKVVETAVHELNDFYSEAPMVLYNIENEDDWNILVTRVWFYRQNEKVYPGPGKYLAVQEYGGDYPDEYYIHEYDNYMAGMRHYYNSVYKQLEDAYYEFNT